MDIPLHRTDDAIRHGDSNHHNNAKRHKTSHAHHDAAINDIFEMDDTEISDTATGTITTATSTATTHANTGWNDTTQTPLTGDHNSDSYQQLSNVDREIHPSGSDTKYALRLQEVGIYNHHFESTTVRYPSSTILIHRSTGRKCTLSSN
jgi:hypothetical protein